MNLRELIKAQEKQKTVELIQKNRASIFEKDQNGINALLLAAYYGNKTISNLIIDLILFQVIRLNCVHWE